MISIIALWGQCHVESNFLEIQQSAHRWYIAELEFKPKQSETRAHVEKYLCLSKLTIENQKKWYF